MKTNIRFLVYNAFGIGGTVKTIFNFADYFQKTGKYDVEIISIRKTSETPTLYLNPKVKITVIQDARRGAVYSEEDRILLSQPSQLINKEEDLYLMFNAYTDKKLKVILGGYHDGVIVATMPSFNMLITSLVNNRVLKIGQEHKSFNDHTGDLQKMIRDYYGELDALTILTKRNQHVYQNKIKNPPAIYVLGNGTERLPFRANLKNHVIIAAGRYSEEKGYDMLIKAYSLIHDKFPDWILKIYGNGLCEKQYLELIKRYSMQNRVILEPATEVLNEKLSTAAFQVCSSYREGFGMSIIEGFAMGVPCVSFACDGPKEIITDGYDGLIVPKEDINALAEAMEKMMSDYDYRLEMGKNAYETSKKYDICTIGKYFQQLVEHEMPLKKQRLDAQNKKQPTEEFAPTKKADCVQKETVLPKNETVNVGYLNYEELIANSRKGRIGLKTIIQMIKGWFLYKFSKKNEE